MDSCNIGQVHEEKAADKAEPAKRAEKGPTAIASNAASFTTEPLSNLQSIAPVFSTSDLKRWLDHYCALGFDVESYGDEYGFARNSGVEIHVSLNRDHDPAHSAGCAYLAVDDSDALHSQWSAVEGGRGPAPVDTEYGLREGGHIDPDGNLLRYGSPIKVETNT